ncbi:MAG: hypothetical protein J3K34DRAFT_266691 [Monoraphidium minutum]|nr:MAG: hypothetical protein J3K34DRAFT_266691 [Monoraphidium minutum]
MGGRQEAAASPRRAAAARRRRRPRAGSAGSAGSAAAAGCRAPRCRRRPRATAAAAVARARAAVALSAPRMRQSRPAFTSTPAGRERARVEAVGGARVEGDGPVGRRRRGGVCDCERRSERRADGGVGDDATHAWGPRAGEGRAGGDEMGARQAVPCVERGPPQGCQAHAQARAQRRAILHASLHAGRPGRALVMRQLLLRVQAAKHYSKGRRRLVRARRRPRGGRQAGGHWQARATSGQ